MKTALRIGWILLCLALALAARCWNLRDVFVEGRIYFVDADCYSRMTRARTVAENPGIVVRHHDFENWPRGVTPHTTAPLDYLIVGLKRILDFGFWILDSGKTSVLHDQTLDLAGTLVSPLLGVAGAVFLAVWAWVLRLRFWGMALLLYALSPILVHGTALGRPDHQAPLIVLLMIALGAELALARDDAPRSAWGVVSGIVWALSLWVSLYEPLILLCLVIALWLILDRRGLCARERLPGAVAFAAILAAAFLIEGWRIEAPDAAMRAYFMNWKRTIGELAHLDLRSPLLFDWLGWGALAAPFLLVAARKTDRRSLPVLCLLGATAALTLWQVRWGYFLGVVFVLSVPWQMLALRKAWIAWPLFLLGLWPVLNDWDARLFPDETAQGLLAMRRAELVALRQLTAATAGDNAGPFLAPWWLSPAIVYWTRNPGVAGSSHQSLSGIVDTARFYLSDDPAVAAAILRARKVRWVFADEPSREIGTSVALLGVTPPANPLAKLLFQEPQDAPAFLWEWKQTRKDSRPSDGGLRFYRLYLVDDAKLPP